MESGSRHTKLINVLRVLLLLVVGLMALGAGVRAMNAGLSCPDWPLCFGQVIPDFHPAVYFEFIHRAYAGVVSLLFFATCAYVLFARGAKALPLSAKRAAVTGLFVLLLQIIAGGLTVLWKVKWFTVTSHLMLATLFFTSVLWMLYAIRPQVDESGGRAPAALKQIVALLGLVTFLQIFMGGVVAATYAGSVCVDWPLCGGQWVPTWSGPIGHQIIHRFIAYGLGLAFLVLAVVLHVLKMRRNPSWLSEQILGLSRWAAIVVLLQVVVGVLNLVLFMPPLVTVLHQTVGVVLFAINIRFYLVARTLQRTEKACAAGHVRVSQGFVGVSG